MNGYLSRFAYFYPVKELFKIENGIEPGAGVLAISIGDQHFSFAVTDSQSKRLGRLDYFSHDFEFEEILAFIRENEIFRENYFKTLVVFDFKKHSLLPASIEHQDYASVLKEIYQVANTSVIISENISGSGITNTYAVPLKIREFVRAAFPSAVTTHRVTLDARYAAESGSEIQIDFSPSTFSVLVSNNKDIRLARSFEYETPDDVIYWLLKIIRLSGLSQHETMVSVSGLIERDSSLAAQLHLYFAQIRFADAGWNDQSGVPSHYFTVLNRLSLCE